MQKQLMGARIILIKNAILDGRTTVVFKWIGWMDGLSNHLKVRFFTSDFCTVPPGLLAQLCKGLTSA